MRYPHALRSLLGALPIAVNIDGQAKANVLRGLDTLFEPTTRRHIVEVEGAHLSVDVAQSAERLLFYAPRNVLRHFRRSDLGRVIARVFGRERGLFVDVGANLGLYGLLARQHNAKALLFEPEPSHADFLRRNASRLGDPVEIALSDYAGTAAFHVGDARHSGASSLRDTDDGGSIYSTTIEVQVETFDSWAAEQDLDLGAIRLIKVDVEGNEAATLRGMCGYLSRPDAAPVWCEVRGPESGRGANSYREAIEIMAPYGYRPFVTQRGRVRPFDPKRDVQQVFDLAFLVSERHAYLTAP